MIVYFNHNLVIDKEYMNFNEMHILIVTRSVILLEFKYSQRSDSTYQKGYLNTLVLCINENIH